MVDTTKGSGSSRKRGASNVVPTGRVDRHGKPIMQPAPPKPQELVTIGGRKYTREAAEIRLAGKTALAPGETVPALETYMQPKPGVGKARVTDPRMLGKVFKEGREVPLLESLRPEALKFTGAIAKYRQQEADVLLQRQKMSRLGYSERFETTPSGERISYTLKPEVTAGIEKFWELGGYEKRVPSLGEQELLQTSIGKPVLIKTVRGVSYDKGTSFLAGGTIISDAINTFSSGAGRVALLEKGKDFFSPKKIWTDIKTVYGAVRETSITPKTLLRGGRGILSLPSRFLVGAGKLVYAPNFGGATSIFNIEREKIFRSKPILNIGQEKIFRSKTKLLFDPDVQLFTLGTGGVLAVAATPAAIVPLIGLGAGFTRQKLREQAVRPTAFGIGELAFLGGTTAFPIIKGVGRSFGNIFGSVGAKYVPSAEVFDVKVLAGKQTFPLTKSAGAAVESFKATAQRVGIERLSGGKWEASTFEQAGLKPVYRVYGAHATDVVFPKIAEVQPGIRTEHGLFVTPKGRGSPYFLRLGGLGQEVEIGFLPSIARPGLVEVGLTDVSRAPKGALVSDTSMNKFLSGEVGTGKAYISRKLEVGRGGELEAILPETSVLERVSGTGVLGRLRGYERYTIYKGRVIPIREYVAEAGRADARGKIRKDYGKEIIRSSKDFSDYVGKRRVSIIEVMRSGVSSRASSLTSSKVFPSSALSTARYDVRSTVVPSRAVSTSYSKVFGRSTAYSMTDYSKLSTLRSTSVATSRYDIRDITSYVTSSDIITLPPPPIDLFGLSRKFKDKKAGIKGKRGKALRVKSIYTPSVEAIYLGIYGSKKGVSIPSLQFRPKVR